MKSKKHIVVIGGGFAGLNFIKKIDIEKYSVTLLDKNNYHAFPPLFYQVASSGIEPLNITFPLRKELRKQMKRGVSYVYGKAKMIDFAAHTITTDDNVIKYDKIVLAMGTTNNFFGNTELADKVYTLKSTPEAVECRNVILKQLERAALQTDADRRRQMLSFVVVGGGPTGVEIAGALGELKRYILTREYPDLNPDEMSITIVEGSDRVLRTMSEKSSLDALIALKELLVNVRTGHNMKSYDDNIVTLDDGTTLDAGMVIWSAGITGTPIEIEGTDIKPGHGGRWLTDRYCAIKGIEDAYAIGDISICQDDPAWPFGHPQLAQPAIQQGKLLAENLNSDKQQKFTYRDKGTMATIGRNRAVVDMKGGVHFSGFIAWLAWMFVHLMSLLGMRNKLSVLMSWTWSYFTYTSGARIILSAIHRPK